jgi:hypothetical protein
MKDTLKVLLDANVDKLFVVFGILLLVVAVVGKVKDWFDPGPVGRALGVFIGSALTIVGIGLWAISANPALLNEQHAGGEGRPIVNPRPAVSKPEPADTSDQVSDDPAPPPTRKFNVTGTYQGSEQFMNGLVTRFAWTSEQEGKDVTGSYRNQTGDYGTFSATIKGSAMNGRFVSQALPGVACNFETTLSRSGATVSGALVCGDGTRARFFANRQ